jgi:F-type H+-transporting ATPase subunit c
MIGAAALIGMARNPENSEKIQIAMIIAIAFAEAIAIYALIIALILKFVS